MKKLLALRRILLLMPLVAVLTVKANAQTPPLDSIKKNICGKVTRELVPGTLRVYYMKGHGAVEMGVHRFHHPGHDDTEPVGEGKFIHLWQCKDGAWKITRVISYDHHAAK